MRPDGGFLLVDGSRANVAVRRDRIYCDIAALVIGAKHIAAGAVGRQKGRCIRLRCRPQQRQVAGRGIDPVARDRWPRAITDGPPAAATSPRFVSPPLSPFNASRLSFSLRAERAGAMGQCQFMPSTFLGYAVDYDGDGRRDIWNDRADALASIANFIARLGWRGGEGWGREVMLPSGFDERSTGLAVKRPTGEWSRLGVRSMDAGPLSGRESEASLVMPDGTGGPAFLVYDNFRTIMRWNKSTYFAAAVGYLADSMARA